MRPAILAILSCPLAAGAALNAQAPNNRLITGKLAYVSSMPMDMDRWLADGLRAWGRYRMTANPEGVDLVVNANTVEKDPQYARNRQGVPQPKKDKNAFPIESVTVVDWVTNRALWQADLINKKPNKDAPEPSPSQHTTIAVRGLAPDQIAQEITRRLRQYVEQLSKEQAGAH